MTLPTSGALSLNDIKGEFGGPTSPSLGDYYAGGAYVPAGTSGTNGAVPSSGTISISNFYGTSNVPALSVTADDASGTGAGFTPTGFVTSSYGPNTTPSGGVSPYSYAWTHISTDSGNTPNVSSATAPNPSWSTDVDDGIPSASTWRVTVTDSGSRTASTDITVILTWINMS